jgi:hypothetical protein
MIPATRPSAKIPSTDESATAAWTSSKTTTTTTAAASTRAAYETTTSTCARTTAAGGRASARSRRAAASMARKSKLGVSRSRYKRRDQEGGCDRRKKLLHGSIPSAPTTISAWM